MRGSQKMNMSGKCVGPRWLGKIRHRLGRWRTAHLGEHGHHRHGWHGHECAFRTGHSSFTFQTRCSGSFLDVWVGLGYRCWVFLDSVGIDVTPHTYHLVQVDVHLPWQSYCVSLWWCVLVSGHACSGHCSQVSSFSVANEFTCVDDPQLLCQDSSFSV